MPKRANRLGPSGVGTPHKTCSPIDIDLASFLETCSRPSWTHLNKIERAVDKLSCARAYSKAYNFPVHLANVTIFCAKRLHVSQYSAEALLGSSTQPSEVLLQSSSPSVPDRNAETSMSEPPFSHLGHPPSRLTPSPNANLKQGL